MQKLSFKEYLQSKTKLLEAVEVSPVRLATYKVKKYCKMRVGDDKNIKEYVSLKPKQTILVEWKYQSVDLTPDPIWIKFDGVQNINENLQFQTIMSGDKLLKWLDRNTNELSDL